jgi:hypothetical protein
MSEAEGWAWRKDLRGAALSDTERVMMDGLNERVCILCVSIDDYLSFVIYISLLGVCCFYCFIIFTHA